MSLDFAHVHRLRTAVADALILDAGARADDASRARVAVAEALAEALAEHHVLVDLERVATRARELYWGERLR